MSFDPKLLLAQYGAGQMYIARQDFENAIKCFDNVYKANTNTLQNENDANKNSEILNYESLKILSNLFSKDEKNLDKAIDNSKKLVEALSV